MDGQTTPGTTETRTERTQPARDPRLSPSGAPYGPPESPEQWARLHAEMTARASWTPEHGTAHIGLHSYAEWRARGGWEPSPAECRLVVERHGHTVAVGHDGLRVDGQLVSPRPPTKAEAKTAGDPYNFPAFQVTPAGAVVYHGRIVAHLESGQDPVLFGESAPVWARGAGHTVVIDHRGLCVDGVRVADHPMPPPGPGDTPARITRDGRVFYAGRLIAELTPDAKNPAAPPRLHLQPEPPRALEPRHVDIPPGRPPPVQPRIREPEPEYDDDIDI
jgi:hypothetical protein